MNLTDETAKILIAELRENTRLLKWQKTHVQKKAEAWVPPAQLRQQTVWKTSSQIIRAREKGSVLFKLEGGGDRGRFLYDLSSINELFLDKTFNNGVPLDKNWSVGVATPTHYDEITIAKQAGPEKNIVESVFLPQWVFLNEILERTVFKSVSLLKFARDRGFITFEVRRSAFKIHYRYDIANINSIFLDKSFNEI